MVDGIEHRAPDEIERGHLSVEVSDLVSSWARRLAGLGPQDRHGSVDEEDTANVETKAAWLARLPVAEMVKEFAELGMSSDVRQALKLGATFAEIGEALDISRQAAEQRFGYLLEGMRVAVAISRRDRVRILPADPRGRVGEIGGEQQYASDRGIWPIGKRVRAEARYAIVAVDGTVRRVYPLDPHGWREVELGKWQFTAISDRELTDEEIDAANAAGELPLRPGDACPTRAGGAYRPHWF